MAEQEPIILFKQALKDPQIEGLECICPSLVGELSRLVKELPDSAWVSEWRYGMSVITYRYYLHLNEVGSQLKKAHDEGKRAGHPFFTGIYSKQDLEKLLAKYEAGVESQQCIP